jgi:glycosyltransferase involved in cell wall biosynthesis
VSITCKGWKRESNPAPQVSIGLPVYNCENFLAAALDSLVTQTFTDFELIISDNASTDGTSDICRDYAAKDPRIRYFRSEVNRGAALSIFLKIKNRNINTKSLSAS